VKALAVSYGGLDGGAQRDLLDFAAALGPEAAVACPEGPIAERGRAAGIRVLRIAERSAEVRHSLNDRLAAPARLAAHAGDTRRLVQAFDPAVLVGWGMRAGLAAAAMAAGMRRRPALVFRHGDLVPGPLIGRAVGAAARRMDIVCCASEAIARDLDPTGSLDERIRVITPGVALERFGPASRQQRGDGVLLLGAIVRWKRPEIALEAVAAAAREVPGIRLTVAGAPLDASGRALEQRLRRRAQEPDLAGRVHFPGWLEDPREALGRAACVIHCSDCEPYGRVLIEALASGTPVVAPAACGPLEIVDETCGRLFAPGDPEAAARALIDVLRPSGRAEELGRAGRVRAEQRFALDRTHRRYRELVADAAARSAARRSPEHAARPAAARRASPTPGSDTTLVTVTHNSERELRTLLDSTGRLLPGAHVVVVDSGSSDRSVAVATEAGDRVTSIAITENVGYGRGVNVGLPAVRTPVTLVSNPDIELIDDSVIALTEEVRRSDRPERILAPVVLLPDGKRQDSVHPTPTSAPELVNALLPPAALPGALGLPLAPWRSNRPRRVGWAIGCCIVARTETLRRLGPFDDETFLFAEDMDLGLRARAAGIETWFWPSARVIHRRSHSTGPAFGGEPFELLAERRRSVVQRRCGPTRTRIDDAAQVTTFGSRIVLKRLLGWPAARERRQIEALQTVRRRSTQHSSGA